MANSSALFTSDDEEPLVIMKEKDLRKKLQRLLQGVPPPSSITISTLSAEEILSKYKENEPAFGLSNLDKSDSDSLKKNDSDLMSFKNNSDVSEDIAGLLQKVQERYVQLETMSSCNVWFQQSIPLTGSAKKRCRARQRVGLSPGRRLSHLARRKQIFSCANLQRMADMEKKKHLEIKKSGIYQDKVKVTEKRVQYEKLNMPKRALFLSPEDEFSNNSQTVKEFPKRKLFSSSEKKKKLPLKENSKRSEVKRWLFHQNFTSEVSRKRLRDENSDQVPERKTKCPRRSLTFDEDESSKSPASSSTRSSHSLPPLSENHKNKLLWAVSVALKEANISRKDGNFKTCASSLFMTLRKNLNNILNSYSETSSTSEKMLLFARQSIPSLLEKLGLPPLSNNRGVLTPVKNQKSEQTHVKTNEGGKENSDKTTPAKGDFNVVFKTPKKFIRVKKKSKTCDKTKGRSYFKGVLVRCKSLESLNTSGEENKGSVAKNLFSQMDNSSNFVGDETINNCDDSCVSFNQDNTISEMTFLNDSDTNLASHSLTPSSVSDETDGSLLLAALKKRDVNITEEDNDSEGSNEIGNQDFKQEETVKGGEDLGGEERIEESEDEERSEVLKEPALVEESGDEEEEKEARNEEVGGGTMVEESADEDEEEEVKFEEQSEVKEETSMVQDEEAEEKEIRNERTQDLVVVEESEDEEEEEVIKNEEKDEILRGLDVVNESGNEEENEGSEIDMFLDEPEPVRMIKDEEEKKEAVIEEEIKMDISENMIKEESIVEMMEAEEEAIETNEDVVEIEKGEVRDDEIIVKKEENYEEMVKTCEKIKEEMSPCVIDAQNDSMLPPQTSTPILSPVLKRTKNRKLMVKKTKKNWKIVRDQSQEDSVPTEDLKLKVRLSHEWEVIALNSSASELESSCNMNQSSMISFCNESYQQTDTLEESDSKLSENVTEDEEDLSAIRLRELLQEKNFVEIEPEPLVSEVKEEQDVEIVAGDILPNEAQTDNNEGDMNTCLPPSTVDHEALQEIIKSENKYLKPDECTPGKRPNSPVLTNSDQKKRVLSLENYKARKQQEASNDLDGISPLKSDDGSNAEMSNSSMEIPWKKIYHIRLKSSTDHKKKRKHRREEKITPEKEEKHHRSRRDRSMEAVEDCSTESRRYHKSRHSGSEHNKSIETPEIDKISPEKQEKHESINSSCEHGKPTEAHKGNALTPEKVLEGVKAIQGLFKALFDISNVLDQQIKYAKENPGSMHQEAVAKTLEAGSLISDAINNSLEEMKKEQGNAEVTNAWLDLLSNFYTNNPLLKTNEKESPKDPRVKNNEPSCSKDVTPKQNQDKNSLYKPYSLINEETPPRQIPNNVQPPPIHQNVQLPNEQTPPKPVAIVAPPPLIQNHKVQVLDKCTPPRIGGFVAQPSPLAQNNVQIPNEYTPPKPMAFVAQPPPPPIIHNVQLPNEHTPPRQILHIPQNASNNLYKQAVERNNQNWHERNSWANSPVVQNTSHTNRSYYQNEIPRKPLLEGSPGFLSYNNPGGSSSSSNQILRASENPGYWIKNRDDVSNSSKSRLEGTPGFSNYNYPQNIPQHSQRPQSNYPHYSGMNRGIPSHRVEEFCSPERNTSRYYNQSYHTPENYMYNNHSISPSPNGLYNYTSWNSSNMNNGHWNGFQQSPVSKTFRRSMVPQMTEASYYTNC